MAGLLRFSGLSQFTFLPTNVGIETGDRLGSSRFSISRDRFENTVAESICTCYSNLSGQPDIFLGSGTFKISGTRLFAKSRV